MTAEQLKNSLLQEAISGRLVPQDPNDEPASVLLEKIRDEKARLIKEGKLKKEKPSAPITDDEKPFEIPNTWKWVRHNYLFNISGGTQPPKSEFIYEPREGYIQLYQIRDYGKNPQPVYIPYKRTLKISKEGDILLARYGASLGKVFFAKDGAYNVAIARVIPQYESELIDKMYIYWYYRSSIYQRHITDRSRCAQAGFNKEDLNDLYFPLPPLAEQKRIVAKLEELLPIVEQYGKAQTELDELNAALPARLRQSILQQAIQGKLVPQDPDDEPVEELLKRIEAEKQQLIKEGKLKKERPSTTITEDEIPFEIPNTWKWVRLKNIVYNHGQKTPDKKFSYIDIGSIDNKHQRLNSKESIIEAKDAPSRARKIVVRGDIIYSTVRPYLHNIAIIDRYFTEEPIASTGFAVFSCHTGIINKFLFYYLLSPAFDSYANDGDNAKGVAYPAINDDKLYKAIVPLPPLAEQQSIVAKIEELFAEIDKLK